MLPNSSATKAARHRRVLPDGRRATDQDPLAGITEQPHSCATSHRSVLRAVLPATWLQTDKLNAAAVDRELAHDLDPPLQNDLIDAAQQVVRFGAEDLVERERPGGQRIRVQHDEWHDQQIPGPGSRRAGGDQGRHVLRQRHGTAEYRVVHRRRRRILCSGSRARHGFDHVYLRDLLRLELSGACRGHRQPVPVRRQRDGSRDLEAGQLPVRACLLRQRVHYRAGPDSHLARVAGERH